MLSPLGRGSGPPFVSLAHLSAVADVNCPTMLKPATLGRVRVRYLLALCALIGIGAYGTSASYTDASYVAATFSTGTIDLTVAGSSGVFAQGSPSELSLTQLTATGMYPGGPAAIGELRLRNTGLVALNLSALAFTTTNSGGIANDAGTTALGQIARLKVVAYSGAGVQRDAHDRRRYPAPGDRHDLDGTAHACRRCHGDLLPQGEHSEHRHRCSPRSTQRRHATPRSCDGSTGLRP